MSENDELMKLLFVFYSLSRWLFGGEIEIQQPPFSASIVALVIDSLPAESHALHPGFAFILKSNK